MTRPKFGIFDHIEDIPGTPTSQLFKERLELIKMADEAGFGGFHLAEHHGGELCMAPSQEVFVAAASQVTKNIHLGPMVKLLPMHSPVRFEPSGFRVPPCSRSRPPWNGIDGWGRP